MREETQPMALRIKCAKVILDKDNKSGATPQLDGEHSIGRLLVKFVSPENLRGVILAARRCCMSVTATARSTNGDDTGSGAVYFR